MLLELPSLIEVRGTSSSGFEIRIHDSMAPDRSELLAKLRQLQNVMETAEWEVISERTSILIRTFCEKSRIIHEKVLCVTCAKRVDSETEIGLKDEIIEAVRLHDLLLKISVVKEYLRVGKSKETSLPLIGKELKYLANIALRRNLLNKLSETSPTVLSSLRVSAELVGTVKQGDLVSTSTEVWNHLLWLTEYFRLRIDAELHELGHEVDSLYDSGEYHSDVLKNISEFVCNGFQLLRSNGASKILQSPPFLALANTVEACALYAGDLYEDLSSLLATKSSEDSEGLLFQKRVELWGDLAEVSLILTSVSKQLVERPPFVQLRGIKTTSPLELRVLTYPSIDGRGIFIAQCLDIDLVAAGAGEALAIAQLQTVVQVWHREMSTGKDGLLHPTVAPANFHAAFVDAVPAEPFPCNKCEGVVLKIRRYSSPVESSHKFVSSELLETKAKKIARAF